MTARERDYIRDGDEIYRRSFAIIRAEADLARFTPAEERVAVRIVHACGMVEAARDIVFHPDFTAAASQALKAGAPDLLRFADGGERHHPRAAAREQRDRLHARPSGRAGRSQRSSDNTRTAAALELWRPRLKGSVVVIGNAPTALFRLLELLDEGADRPAAIIGMPVGFVGAAEFEGSADRGRARALRGGARA